MEAVFHSVCGVVQCPQLAYRLAQSSFVSRWLVAGLHEHLGTATPRNLPRRTGPGHYKPPNGVEARKENTLPATTFCPVRRSSSRIGFIAFAPAYTPAVTTAPFIPANPGASTPGRAASRPRNFRCRRRVHSTNGDQTACTRLLRMSQYQRWFERL